MRAALIALKVCQAGGIKGKKVADFMLYPDGKIQAPKRQTPAQMAAILNKVV